MRAGLSSWDSVRGGVCCILALICSLFRVNWFIPLPTIIGIIRFNGRPHLRAARETVTPAVMKALNICRFGGIPTAVLFIVFAYPSPGRLLWRVRLDRDEVVAALTKNMKVLHFVVSFFCWRSPYGD